MATNNIDYASLKGLPLGNTYLNQIISDKLYYVDKTPYIKKVFKDNTSKVLLITRPRRFGKSLAMDTFNRFLSINPENPGDTSYQDAIFKDTKIYEDKEFCREYMGKYPVISISLKAVSGDDYDVARGNLAGFVATIANRHEYLLNSPIFTNDEKKRFSILKDVTKLAFKEYESVLHQSLLTISEMLYRYFGKEVVLLIDEYDVPLAYAYANGYYDKMVGLIRNLLLNILKENNYFKKAVLTGCLRVSKESIFTGLNNPEVNTVTNDRDEFAECMGFTKDEVRTMLNYYGLSEYEGAVKDWYDGYRICESEIFCPWDVVSFCKQTVQEIKSGLRISGPKSFWTATGTNDVIQQFMPYLDEQAAEDMQTLLGGGQIVFTLNEELSYKEIGDNHDINDFWTLLVYTGYLTAVETDDQGKACAVRIPNKEIRKAFEHCIADYYQNSFVMKGDSDKFISALLTGNGRQVLAILQDKLKNFVSISDFETKAKSENYYQGFLNGIFSASSKQFTNFSSNTPAGDGYADLIFTSKDLSVGVVIELKSTKQENTLDKLAGDALNQIKTKKYFEYFKGKFVEKVYCYGIAFCRKDCSIKMDVMEL